MNSYSLHHSDYVFVKEDSFPDGENMNFLPVLKERYQIGQLDSEFSIGRGVVFSGQVDGASFSFGRLVIMYSGKIKILNRFG